MSRKRVAIIGAGRVGGALGRLLAEAGYEVTALVARSRESAERASAFVGAGRALTDPAEAATTADIVIIATPDGAIRPVCEEIADRGGLRGKPTVVHVSGAHSLDLLDAAKAAGAPRAVLHPLQSVPGMEQGLANLRGSFFRIEADPESLEVARELVTAIGGMELELRRWTSDDTSAALYHAGAVAVSNYLVALVDYGLRLYEALGAGREEALEAVLPLIRGTLANIEKLGPTRALTGPIARGDVETVRRHVAALRERAPELLALYRELARHTTVIAREGGLAEETADELLRTLCQAVHSSRAGDCDADGP